MILRNFTILLTAILQAFLTAKADSIDPTYYADLTPLHRRRNLENFHQNLEANFIQSPAPPSFTSEVEAAIRAHTAAYQATRARDLSQQRHAILDSPSSAPNKVYDSTKGVEGIATNVKVYSDNPAKVFETALGEQGYFPRNAPKVYYTPRSYFVQNNVPQLAPVFEQPLTVTTTSERPYDFLKDAEKKQAIILPPPRAQHYEKIWPLGKLHYITLNVAVQTPHGTRHSHFAQPKNNNENHNNNVRPNLDPATHFYQLLGQQTQSRNDVASEVRNNLAQVAITRAWEALQNKYYYK